MEKCLGQLEFFLLEWIMTIYVSGINGRCNDIYVKQESYIAEASSKVSIHSPWKYTYIILNRNKKEKQSQNSSYMKERVNKHFHCKNNHPRSTPPNQ